MAATAYSSAYVPTTADEATKPSAFQKFAKSFIEQRTAKARQMMAWHINNYSDEKLAQFGWTAADIKRMRNAG